MAKGRKQNTKARPETPETTGNFSRSDWRKAGMTREQHKYCANIIKSLKQYKHVGPFLDPVDPIKLNVPDYHDIVKTPMDLGTVERRLNNCEYESTLDFAADVRLIFGNCYLYNGVQATISQFARDMEDIFNNSFSKMPGESVLVNPPQTSTAQKVRKTPKVPKAPKVAESSSSTAASEIQRPKREIRPPPSKDLPDTQSLKRKKPSKKNNDISFCRGVLKELKKKQHYPYAYPFYEPVDAEKLQVPDYYTVIKQPRDIQTISNKLENDQYENAKAFEDDIRLMFRNCYTYNPVGSDVYRMGKQLEEVFDRKWKERPMPQTRQTSAEPQADDSSESVEEDDESQQHLKALQKHLAALQTQIASMQKPSKTKPKKASSKTSKTSSKKGGTKTTKDAPPKKNSKKPRPSTAAPRPVIMEEESPLSAEQKNDLSERILHLSEEGMSDLIELIRASGAPLEADDGNYELEIESVDNATARKIYDFVLSNTNLPKKPPAKKQRVAYNEAEQQRQIEQLETQLKKFEPTNDEESAESHVTSSVPMEYVEYSNYDISQDESSDAETESSGTGTDDSEKSPRPAKRTVSRKSSCTSKSTLASRNSSTNKASTSIAKQPTINNASSIASTSTDRKPSVSNAKSTFSNPTSISAIKNSSASNTKSTTSNSASISTTKKTAASNMSSINPTSLSMASKSSLSDTKTSVISNPSGFTSTLTRAPTNKRKSPATTESFGSISTLAKTPTDKGKVLATSEFSPTNGKLTVAGQPTTSSSIVTGVNKPELFGSTLAGQTTFPNSKFIGNGGPISLNSLSTEAIQSKYFAPKSMRASQSDLFGSTVAGKSTKAGKLDLDSLPPLPNSISTGVGQGKLSYLETLDSVETPVEIYRNVAIPPIPMIKHELDELARRKQEKEEEFKRKREEFLRAIQEQEEQAAREKEKAAREKEKAEREERRKQYRLMQIKNLREKDRVRHEKYIKHTEKKEFCYHQLSEAQEYLSTHEFEIYRYHVEKAGVWGLALPHP